MPRKVKDRALDSRDGRSKLKPRDAAYWRSIDRGSHIGYRRIAGKAGTWWARHYAGDGRYTVEPLGTADDRVAADGVTALDFWQALHKARERSAGHRGESLGPLTVEQAMASYIEWLRGAGKGAVDAEVKARMILPALGSIPVADLTTQRLRHWLVDLAETGRRLRTSPGNAQRFDKIASDDESMRKRRSTANRVFKVLRACLNHAFRDGRIASDLAWRRVQPFAAVEAARIQYLTIAEAQRLLNACPADFRLLVRAALETGARYSELTRITARSFNRDAGTIAIDRSKTGKPRHVILTPDGVAFFATLAAGKDRDDLLLRKADGEAWGEGQQKARMRDICRIARINPPIVFHGLRHTWASLSVMNGVPLLVVARNLGHADVKMVVKHYGHLAPSYERSAILSGAPRFGIKPGNVRPMERRR